MPFTPVAIVGRACVLPGALSAQELWQAVADGRDLLTDAPAGRWRLDDVHALGDPPHVMDRSWSKRGGYVQNFHEVFDPEGFNLPASEVLSLDPIFQWCLHTARAALRDAGYSATPSGTGAIFGNLSFPSSGLARFAEAQWMSQQDFIDETMLSHLQLADVNPMDRFMSGLPAAVLQRSLALDRGAHALDAACASSLYAIKQACTWLQRGKADVMLAGAVNRSDDLFIHVGFCALQALSRQGRSRPFHQRADGLVPAEGAGFVVLKRLADAERDGDRILGLIRGVGLSNDGRSSSFLAPSIEGQVRAMTGAYQQAGIDPSSIQLLECHATGTTVGDATELRSSAQVFRNAEQLPIASLKSNLGHLITAAGVAGLIKLIEAMDAGQRPPSLHADDLDPAVSETPFRVLTELEQWPSQGPRRAGLSAFGFGGNNAHLVLEQYDKKSSTTSVPVSSINEDEPAKIALVGLSVRVGNLPDTAAFVRALSDPDGDYLTPCSEIELAIQGLRFPPQDLESALPQQNLLLAAARELDSQLVDLPRERTGVFVGMEADPEVARYGLRWRLAQWADLLNGDGEWLAKARQSVIPGLEAAGVVGTMPNIPANRLNRQFDFGGGSCTVSAGELSGIVALEQACQAIQSGELEAALVAAVDLSCNEIHQAALNSIDGTEESQPGDAAVLVVLKSLTDARRDGDDILAVIGRKPGIECLELDSTSIDRRFGKAHAATGLLGLAVGALSLRDGALADGQAWQQGIERSLLLRVPQLQGVSKELHLHLPLEELGKTPTGRNKASSDLGRVLKLPAHRPPPILPKPTTVDTPKAIEMSPQIMKPAPVLAPVWAPTNVVAPEPLEFSTPPGPSEPAASVARAIPAPEPQPTTSASASGFVGAVQRHFEDMSEQHQTYLELQRQVHEQFLGTRQRMMDQLLRVAGGSPVGPARAWSPAPVIAEPKKPVQQIAATLPKTQEPGISVPPEPVAAPTIIESTEPTSATPPTGPTLDRGQLQIHASGKISEIYGPLFEQQDQFARQVRMPEPPLLLADRVTGIDAEPGVLGTGTLWTETDVTDESWYLNNGRMPAGVMIEAGQADLMLISWMGIDFLNQGDRVYRLLGCQLTYHNNLPTPGETLTYDIHVDGHAKHGDVRLFFFHYGCRVNGQLRLTISQGQAGFFTDQELADSDGILWTPEDQEIVATPRLDQPERLTERRSLSTEQVQAFSEGHLWQCFGPGFELGETHTRTPKIQSGDMLFLDQVTDLQPEGGPWGHGYLRASSAITPEHWFFDGHFRNDPCMPGTLMFEGCLQAMSIYLAGLGFSLNRDGWRFQPVPGEPFDLRCRGQAIPTNKEIIYEVFVEEVIGGESPTLYADLLCTIDGLKAFHARRVGLQLVPDWPLTSKPELLADYTEPKPVAEIDGFKFDYASLLACAWGKPSDAFGPMYEVFDAHRRVARLPGPPYHFMSRLISIDGEIGRCEPGAVIELEYDIPMDAWYFEANGTQTMPFCVFLEAALQPCGWLASFVGSALTSENDLSFRNLDGSATWTEEILPTAGTLRTHVKITEISRTAGMIIESFEVECFVGDQSVYTMQTVFGFFPVEALKNQVGLPTSDEQRAFFNRESNVHVDLRDRSLSVFDPDGLHLPEQQLLMLDRVSGWWPGENDAELVSLRAEKDVDPAEWFFKAHFFQDPVQPGSLGIEAMVQLLQYAMIELNLHEGLERPRFEPLALGKTLSWKYRGQVVPDNKIITTTLEIEEIRPEERLAVASASLWVDGKRIYEAQNLTVRIVKGQDNQTAAQNPPARQPVAFASSFTSATASAPQILDPTADTWVYDHCPTWTRPALPMMVAVELLARAVEGPLHGLADIRIKGWLHSDQRLTFRTERQGNRLSLTYSDENGQATEFASARVLDASSDVPDSLPALDGDLQPDPYQTGQLFHGPAFQLLKSSRLSSEGSSSVLDASAGSLPPGRLHPALLDAATHGIPHDRLQVWFPDLDDGDVAYPAVLEELRLYRSMPTEGEIRCEVRPSGFLGGPRFPRFTIQLLNDDGLICQMALVEACFPKGRLGAAESRARLAFLRDRQFVEGVSLAQRDGDDWVLDAKDVEQLDWLPGTVTALYGTDDPARILLKDAFAHQVQLHPSRLPDALPLTSFEVSQENQDGRHRLRVKNQPQLDLTTVRSFWNGWFERSEWPVEDIFFGLAQRFVGRVELEDPQAIQQLHGRSVLFVANHQVGVESLLFTILASSMIGIPTVTLAKAEHRQSWLGGLIRHCFEYPGIEDPEVIVFFDRTEATSLQGIVKKLGIEMAANRRSLMAHIEGTRSLSCRQPVQTMGAAFIDIALETGVPIVPVRFYGGLPTEELSDRLEFPVGMGRQHILVGTPLMPDELKSLPLGDQKKRIIDGINRQGPANAEERPLPPDPAFAHTVQKWMDEHQAAEGDAAILRILQEIPDPCAATQCLLAGVEQGKLDGQSGLNPLELQWLGELFRRIMGDRQVN